MNKRIPGVPFGDGLYPFMVLGMVYGVLTLYLMLCKLLVRVPSQYTSLCSYKPVIVPSCDKFKDQEVPDSTLVIITSDFVSMNEYSRIDPYSYNLASNRV